MLGDRLPKPCVNRCSIEAYEETHRPIKAVRIISVGATGFELWKRELPELAPVNSPKGDLGRNLVL
jgi:hypothetical protein